MNLFKFKNFQAVSESMAPTLDTGQCARMRWINPMDEPVDYGDVIAFAHQKTQVTFVFRVIAKGGDTVQMMDGAVILNGEPLAQAFQGVDDVPYPTSAPYPLCKKPVSAGEICARSRYTETLPNGVTYDVYDVHETSQGDNTSEFTVPPGHVFVMGDHRDNAYDSRFKLEIGGPGTVPIETILGVFDDL